MSKIVKLFALSLLLVGCNSMYGDGTSKVKKNHGADAYTVKHATNHVDHVTKSVAASASATTTLAKQLP